MAKMDALEKLFVNHWPQYLLHKYFGLTKFLERIPAMEAQKILEIGAGVGRTTRLIAKKYPGAKITATDFEEAQVKAAKQGNNLSNVVFEQADATALPYPDNSFDVCFAILVLHHIGNFADAISELYRVTKPSGHVFVMEFPAKAWPIYRKMPLGTPGVFSKEELVTLFMDKGFKVHGMKGNYLISFAAVK